MGRAFLAQAARSEVRQGGPQAFEQQFVDGAMRDFGMATRVLTRTADTLVFRCYSCPFLEAAESMPGLVCDSLDLGVHEGIDQGLGGVRTERLTCLGHGDPYCEYRVTWRAEAPRPQD
jgi:predicted ArsR family transcriptional regulator